jgi:hypothetical protein
MTMFQSVPKQTNSKGILEEIFSAFFFMQFFYQPKPNFTRMGLRDGGLWRRMMFNIYVKTW